MKLIRALREQLKLSLEEKAGIGLQSVRGTTGQDWGDRDVDACSGATRTAFKHVASDVVAVH